MNDVRGLREKIDVIFKVKAIKIHFDLLWFGLGDDTLSLDTVLTYKYKDKMDFLIFFVNDVSNAD